MSTLPLPPGLRWLRIVCRLGQLVHDGTDLDDNPDLLPNTGRVVIKANPRRIRILEPDGRWRMISIGDREYNIRSDGELVDVNGNLGVKIPDPASPLIDPTPYTATFAVAPTAGEAWSVDITGDGLPDVIDLAAHASTAPIPPSAVPSLESRLASLEAGTGADVSQAVEDYLTANPPAAVADATTATKGILRLAGDLGGTATAPTVPGLAGKANTGHGHAIGDVTGLQSALNGKQPSGTYAPALGPDDNYVTDAEKSALHSHANKAALDAVSGVNTGDQDLSDMVRSVNSIAPDENGNILLDLGDGGGGTPAQAGWFQTSNTPTSTEIQNLLNAADAAGGGVVRLPVGVFDMDATLTIPYGVRLEGVGWTAWKDGELDNPARGTILRFPATVNHVAVRLKERAHIAHLRLQSLAGRPRSGYTAPVGTVGLKVEGNSTRIDSVSCQFFSYAGVLVDSEDAASGGNTSAIKVNHVYAYNLDSSYNHGHGVFLKGSDSNRCVFVGLNAVANRGNQLRLERSSRNWITAHLDAAGVTAEPAVAMVSGIGNVFDCYIEASGTPVGGDRFHIGSEATHGIIMNPFYGRAKITYDSSATLGSWNIFESGGQRRLMQIYPAGGRTNNDTGQANGSFVIDVGVPDGVSMTRMRQMLPGGNAVDVANINSSGSRWEWSIPFRLMNCTTTARPSGMSDGTMVWDSTLGKPIFRKGSGWVDATGATV